MTSVAASSTTKALSFLPIYFKGTVVRGFGRGGRELNCPTANLDEDAVKSFPTDAPTGVYVGFAKVDTDKVYPMAMSIGYNVQYGSEKKTLEVHLLHEFSDDFYGALVTAIAIRYIRPMLQFKDKDELTEAIEHDKEAARDLLKDPELTKWSHHSYFNDNKI